MKRRGFAAVAVALAMLVVAGCGDDGEETSAATINKAQFVKQADAACAKANEQIQADLAALLKTEGFTLNENQTTEQSTLIVSKALVPNIEEQIETIRALGVPSGDEEQVEGILAGLEEGLERAKEDPEGVVQGEIDLFGEAGEIGGEYGLKVCAQG